MRVTFRVNDDVIKNRQFWSAKKCVVKFKSEYIEENKKENLSKLQN